MTKQIGWWLVLAAILGGLWWLAWDQGMTSDKQNAATDTTTQQSQSPAEKTVSGDITAADKDASSIDFGTDFSSSDLDQLTQ